MHRYISLILGAKFKITPNYNIIVIWCYFKFIYLFVKLLLILLKRVYQITVVLATLQI